ncbi:hypothetical protein ACFL39_00815 [Gemmatimonadota bacterium]
MTPDELRAIITWLEERVLLGPAESDHPVAITFPSPTADEMIAAGLNAGGARRLLSVAWWDEMVTDIIETPDLCDPDEPPAEVLAFARDVISEYIRKRFPLEEE